MTDEATNVSGTLRRTLLLDAAALGAVRPALLVELFVLLRAVVVPAFAHLEYGRGRPRRVSIGGAAHDN